MSDTGTFKSSKEEAQNHGMALKGAAGNIISFALTRGQTNLTVIENLMAASQQLSSCNGEFKNLVGNDANSIEDLEAAFEDFDTELVSYMGGK